MIGERAFSGPQFTVLFKRIPAKPPFGFVGKGGAREWSELSRLRGSERNGLCPDAGAFLEKRQEKHFQNK